MTTCSMFLMLIKPLKAVFNIDKYEKRSII